MGVSQLGPIQAQLQQAMYEKNDDKFNLLLQQYRKMGGTDDWLNSQAGIYKYNLPASGVSNHPATPTVIPKVPTPGNLPTDVPGQTISGPDINLGSDRGQIEQESAREKQQQLDLLQKQVDLRTGGLSSLGDILGKKNQAQFAYDLPGIKEDLQKSGLFSSPSALASAVTRESEMLGANTAAQLGQYGLGTIDLQTQGLGAIGQNQTSMQQGGLQRQFSTADYDKQAALAAQIGASSVPNAPGFSFGGALGGAASGGIAAAPLWAANPGIAAGLTGLGAIAGGSKNSASYLCTHLRELGLATQEEVDLVHKKIFEDFKGSLTALFIYGILAPLFIVKADLESFDWASLKPFIIDDIIFEKDSKSAFKRYQFVCKQIFKSLLPNSELVMRRV